MKRLFDALLLSVLLNTSVSAQIEVTDPRLYNLAEKGILHPQGITSNPKTKSFFLVSRSQVTEITSEALVLSSFSISRLTNKADGIAYDPVTEKLLIVSGGERIYAVNSDGSDISRVPYLILQGPRVANGVAVDPVTNHIWIADKDAELLVEYDRSGQQLSLVKTSSFLPSFDDPHGLAFFGDDLLVADDREGSRAVYLVSKSGVLDQFVLAGADYQIDDPEGVAASEDGTICLVTDHESQLLCFSTPFDSEPPQNRVTVPASIGDAEFIGVAVANTITMDNPVRVQAFDQFGAGRLLADAIQPLPSLGQDSFLIAEIERSRTAAALTLQGDWGPVQGFFMLGDFALTRVDGSGGRLEASTQLVFPQLRITETEASYLFLFNPSPESRSEVQLRVLDPVGIQIGSGAFSLDPMGSRTGSLQEMIAHRLQLEEGYLVIESSIPVQGLLVKQHPEHLTMVPGLRSSPRLSVSAAHFFWGPLGTTELRLLNLEPESTRYRISIWLDDQADPLVAHEEVGPGVLMTTGLKKIFPSVPEPASGFIQVAAEGETGEETARRFLALLTYLGAQEKTAATVPMSAEGRRKSIYIHIAQTDSPLLFQGLAIANPGSATANLTLRTFQSQGAQTGKRKLRLQPGERIVGLLNESKFLGPEFRQVGGYLKILASEPVHSETIFGGDSFLSALKSQQSFP